MKNDKGYWSYKMKSSKNSLLVDGSYSKIVINPEKHLQLILKFLFLKKMNQNLLQQFFQTFLNCSTYPIYNLDKNDEDHSSDKIEENTLRSLYDHDLEDEEFDDSEYNNLYANSSSDSQISTEDSVSLELQDHYKDQFHKRKTDLSDSSTQKKRKFYK